MLDANKRRAVEMLATGAKQVEVARELGVSPPTVNEWVHKNAEFKAALDEAVQAHVNASRVMMRGRIARVLARVDELIDSPDESVALRAAFGWLDRAGITVGAQDAVAQGAQPSQSDVAEMLEFFKWRAERQATASAETRSEEDGSDPTGTSD